jgi:hypothetical protein
MAQRPMDELVGFAFFIVSTTFEVGNGKYLLNVVAILEWATF